MISGYPRRLIAIARGARLAVVAALPALPAPSLGAQPLVREAATRVVSPRPSVAAVPAAPLLAFHFRRADGVKLGGLAVAAALVGTADRRGDAWARHAGVQDSRTLDVLSQVGDKGGSVAAFAVGPAAWLLGRVRGDSGTAVLGLRTTEAVVASGVLITAAKVLAGRTRPYASADHSPTHWDLFGGLRTDSARSFVSGHSAWAASAAVTLAAEWRRQGRAGWKVAGPPLVYALAAVTAGSRVRDREHWMSDVVSGAAVGMITAIAVRRWHDAHPRSRIDRLFLAH